MVFSDLFFLFVFLPTFALSYLAAHWIDKLLSSEDTRPNRIVENAVLVVFSLIFYAWGEPVYVFLMLFCVLLNYLAGLGIGHTQGTARKWALAGGLTDLQVSEFFCPATDGSRHPCSRPQDCVAHRYQFLHVPVDLLPHRCLSPGGPHATPLR